MKNTLEDKKPTVEEIEAMAKSMAEVEGESFAEWYNNKSD